MPGRVHKGEWATGACGGTGCTALVHRSCSMAQHHSHAKPEPHPERVNHPCSAEGRGKGRGVSRGSAG